MSLTPLQLEFINDYRKNMTGKPTYAMQAELKNWRTTFFVQVPNVTDEERIG
ncbi:hypothetical protein DM02DRAFT_653127 [Periconia macrospinosa]|uniref:Uncharacterized protein n=1 Tax=Periconia macrospinosa TaxID=97972 RepID=A0A2V1E0Y1_9PLEO|nr:hypothetical protein DM02DRAFT_653127 [Periconia macrospinosa]